jgi:organic radical activating enzyme
VNKHVLPFLETMITQVCNLSCAGCTNYSDLEHKGYVKWEDGKQQLEKWLERLDIPDFGIMGGEPLINPQWRQWLYGVRELMPASQLRFTTNGLLLRKYPDIINEMTEVGNVVFKITAHTADADDFIEQALSTHNFETVEEYGIKRWRGANNIRFQVNRPERFVKSYRGTYKTMQPYQSDPALAFDNCCQQTCPLMYQGRIYKCSTVGLLKEVLERFDRCNEEWSPYIDPGIGPDCSNQDLKKFLNNFGKPAKICSMCPTSADVGSSIVHINNVIKKKDVRV